MNLKRLNLLLFLMTSMLFLKAQSETQHYLSFQTGIMHISIHDKQATPVPHAGLGPQPTLQYFQQNSKSRWGIQLGGGLLKIQPVDPELRFYDPGLSCTSAFLSAEYLRSLSHSDKSQVFLGGTIGENLLVDFGAVGYFPWIFGQGGISAKARWEHQLTDKHQFGGGVSLPLVVWITDMPYNQVPRLEGRAPDVVTVFAAGSRLASWNSFQRVDLSLDYHYLFHPKWSLLISGSWSWLHDALPRDFYSTQTKLNAGIQFRW